MAQIYALKYLAKAAASAPRDLVNSYVAKVRPIHPTVLIFHCTFVCDARCEMCHNWKRGDRKTDMTLAEIETAFSSPLWKNIENANVSGGEPTTRNDLVDICRLMLDKLPAPAQARPQHDRSHAASRHPDAHEDRRALQRARRHLQHPRVDRRRRRHAQPGAAGEARVREGQPDDPRDAGPAEDAQLQLRDLDDDLPHEPERRREHPGLGQEGEPGHRLQHGPVHRADARQRRPGRHLRAGRRGRRADAPVLPRSRPDGLAASTVRTTSTCTTPT